MTRRWSVLFLVVLLATLMPATSVAAQPSAACQVRNVTQQTAGSSLAAMVAAAVDGDRLTVRGTCAGRVVIEADLSLRGVAADATLTGGGTGRVLEVRAGATVSLADLTIRDGAAFRGGGILNAGALTVTGVRILDNRAGPRNDCGRVPDPTCDYRRTGANAGGGILNEGTMSLDTSRVLRNQAGQGAGVVNLGTLSMRNSTVARNVASVWVQAAGGGIVNGGTLRIRRSTIARNMIISGEYEATGGGIYSGGRLSLRASTVTKNVAYGSNMGEGGGIANGSVYAGRPGSVVLVATTVTRNEARNWRVRFQEGSGITSCPVDWCGGRGGGVTVRASIIAGNGRDCAGPFTSGGHNLIGAATRACKGFADGVKGDRVGTRADPLDPRLAPLADNGGPTGTHALLAGSPAIDAAGRAPCATPTDQRGVRRPQGVRCDIGAFELR